MQGGWIGSERVGAVEVCEQHDILFLCYILYILSKPIFATLLNIYIYTIYKYNFTVNNTLHEIYKL
jgi:hypothetical protein